MMSHYIPRGRKPRKGINFGEILHFKGTFVDVLTEHAQKRHCSISGLKSDAAIRFPEVGTYKAK